MTTDMAANLSVGGLPFFLRAFTNAVFSFLRKRSMRFFAALNAGLARYFLLLLWFLFLGALLGFALLGFFQFRLEGCCLYSAPLFEEPALAHFSSELQACLSFF